MLELAAPGATCYATPVAGLKTHATVFVRSRAEHTVELSGPGPVVWQVVDLDPTKPFPDLSAWCAHTVREARAYYDAWREDAGA